MGLAALGFVLTPFAWIDTFDVDFSFWALLGMLVATAILLFAVLALLPELRNRPALAGGLAERGPVGQPAGTGLRAAGQPGPVSAGRRLSAGGPQQHAAAAAAASRAARRRPDGPPPPRPAVLRPPTGGRPPGTPGGVDRRGGGPPPNARGLLAA